MNFNNQYMMQGASPYPYPQSSAGYGMNTFTQQAATQQLIQVNGLGGAQNYQVPPNSRVVLFDSNQDVFYIKSTDAGGYPTITAYQFTAIQNQSGLAEEYITRNEFEEFKKEVIKHAKQSVSTEPAAK